ncbi:hypothetical protein BKA64DRAFT_263933 [Cadophora sp. MPI-SDFR-AT-0126]|nr:hypothetical protein BKA64DRAFT_263933 [Leotiomycetes sp. MPI-SDFR-AT-0126]
MTEKNLILWNSDVTNTESKTNEGRDSNLWNSEVTMVGSKVIEERETNLWNSEVTVEESRAIEGPDSILRNSEPMTGATMALDGRGSSSIESLTESRGNGSRAHTSKIIEKRRIPDNERHMIISTTTGNVTVVNHDKGGYDPAGPPLSDATSDDYRRTIERHSKYEPRTRRRGRVEGGSKAASSKIFNSFTISRSSNSLQEETEQDMARHPAENRSTVAENSLPSVKAKSSSAHHSPATDQELWTHNAEGTTFKSRKADMAIAEMISRRQITSIPPISSLAFDENIPSIRNDDHHPSRAVDSDHWPLNLSDSGGSDSRSDSNLAGSGSSETDELCDRLNGSHISDERLARPLMDPARQAVANRVMEQFWIIFNQQWPVGAQQHTADSDQQNHSATAFNGDSRKDTLDSSGKKRARNDGTDDQDENDDENRRSKRQKPRPSDKATFADASRFACLFRKHNASKFNIYSHRSCAQSTYPSISRLKEHLYRSHLVTTYCKRCWQTFKNSEQLDSHLTVDAALICQAVPGNPPEGISPQMERRLRSRKKTHGGQTEEDRWRDMYRLLFPGEEVPSPYFEPPQDESPPSPDSRDLADYEVYVRRELPPLVRSSVMEVLVREMQPVEDSLIANLVNTIQDCQERLFRSYNSRNSQERSIAKQAGNLDDAEINGQGSDRPPSNFLSAAFQQPPLLQNPDLAPGLLGLDSPMIHLGESQPAITSLSSFADNMYLQLHGSDEYCNCPGPCSCAAATSNTSWNHTLSSSSFPPPEPDCDGDEDDNYIDWRSGL